MYKKYIVRLTDCERQRLNEVVRKLKGTSEKVRRAQMLLKADADGPHWQDAPIAEAFDCRVRTIENVRQRFVLEGLDAALERAKRTTPPTPKLLDGEQEARKRSQGVNTSRGADIFSLSEGCNAERVVLYISAL